MATQDFKVIVGLGVTGFSSAKYLANLGVPFAVNDTRPNPPLLNEFKTSFPDVILSLGQLDKNLLQQASQIILSPGVSIHDPIIAAQIARGISVIGDIELFARAIKKPVIAITGTNAKSTVTSLVGAMAHNANIPCKVGGNLGPPVLDLIDPSAELYVLELSSFQLESVLSLAPKVASILNITPDHLDRHGSFEKYIQAKLLIYQRAETIVCNGDDDLTDSPRHLGCKYKFTLSTPAQNEFGIIKKNNENYLAFADQLLLPVRALPLQGLQHQANALAALAIGHAFGFKMAPMIKTLMEFHGLPHRCQKIAEWAGISWFNDSKGTNVGATLAAIEGLGPIIFGKLILIAGGVGKNADFSPLLPAIKKFVKTVILMGEAASILAEVCKDHVAVSFVSSMEEAVAVAQSTAISGDAVLLSPACASWDMFKNFAHRGEVFTALVQQRSGEA